MIFEGYLRYGDVEVANSLRTLSYLRRGLGCADLDTNVTTAHQLPATGSGYTDTYGDEYLADPLGADSLACYCHAYDAGPYVHPAEDAAPWFNANRPESQEFLGLLIRELDMQPVAIRSVSAKTPAGSSVGGLRQQGRQIGVSGVLVAASPAGMAYGRAWLARVLSDPAGGCGLADVEIWPACPSVGETRTMRILADAGLTDGPSVADVDGARGCCLQDTTFTIVSASPWLAAPPVVHVADWPLQAAGIYRTVVCADGGLDAAVRIKMRAGTIGGTVEGVSIKATPTSGGVCPGADTDETIEYAIDRLERGTTLTIDPTRRSVDVADDTTDSSPSGMDALTFTGDFEWMDIAPGDCWCVEIDPTGAGNINPGTVVTVERVDIED